MLLSSLYHLFLLPRKPLLKRSVVDVVWRVLLATAGNYAVVALWTAAFAVSLPLPRPDALLLATMLAFVLFTVLVIVTFRVQRLWHITGLMMVLGLGAITILALMGALG